MANSNSLRYNPTSITRPGVTLQETLDALGMTQSELARRMGRPVKTINEIVKGRAAITPETAFQLERVLNVAAGFWNRLEANYRDWLVRRKDEQNLQRDIAWIDNLPARLMIKRGWIPQSAGVELMRECLCYFGVNSPGEWEDLWFGQGGQFLLSKEFVDDPYSVAVWLRQGELQAREIECADYDSGAFRNAILKARKLLAHSPSECYDRLQSVFAAAGVALVMVPVVRRSGMYGSARWLTPQKALIQLNSNIVSNRRFWLALFHEAGHLLLHGKRQAFIDSDGNDEDEAELEASAFAAEMIAA
jgi:HTH-type transcriptional regulator/antitoxin HigA